MKLLTKIVLGMASLFFVGKFDAKYLLVDVEGPIEGDGGNILSGNQLDSIGGGNIQENEIGKHLFKSQTLQVPKVIRNEL